MKTIIYIFAILSLLFVCCENVDSQELTNLSVEASNGLPSDVNSNLLNDADAENPVSASYPKPQLSALRSSDEFFFDNRLPLMSTADYLIIYGTSTNANPYLKLRHYDDDVDWVIKNDSNQLHIYKQSDTLGYVGINRYGTTLNSNLVVYGKQIATGSTNDGVLRIYDNASKSLVIDGNQIESVSGGLYFNWRTSNSVFIALDSNSTVGIGTDDTTYKLNVNGTIRATEIRVETGWADHVFSSNYNLISLEKVEKQIQENGHLPGVPSFKDVSQNGVSLGEASSILLQKIEELTLYIIAQNKEINKLKNTVEKLQAR